MTDFEIVLLLAVLVLGLVVFLLIKAVIKHKKESNEQLIAYNNAICAEYELKKVSEKQSALLEEKNAECEYLKAQLKQVQKKLDFYLNIEEDSAKLNADTDTPRRKETMDRFVKSVGMARASESEPPVLDDGEPEYTESEYAESDYTEAEQLDPLELDSEQMRACDMMEYSKSNFFITGKAGTGKSFLLEAFCSTTKKKTLILAPTGIAALNVGGVTIHSVFGYYNLVNIDIDDLDTDTLRIKNETKLLLRSVNTIIIDEISMVRADVFEKIDRILQIVNRSLSPFGGKQIIVFGDLFQLPPITKKQEYDYLMDVFGGVYFFNSFAYQDGNFRFLELTVNHRQKDDDGFFELLNRVREGTADTEDLNKLNTRILTEESAYDRFTSILPTKAEVEAVNNQRLDQLEGPEFVYESRILYDKTGKKNVNVEAMFPIAGILRLRKGALVMMVTNEPNHHWVNGTLGIVKALYPDRIVVAINSRLYNVCMDIFSEQEAVYEDGKVKYRDVLKVAQFPMVPAYAMTIHKSQGKTYENIICDIEKCFACGQAYVALSRCASLHGLHLKSAVTAESIKTDPCVLEFYHSQKNPFRKR